MYHHPELQSDQNLFGRSKMSKMDKEEQEILEAFDAGKLQRSTDNEGRKDRHQDYAEAMLKKMRALTSGFPLRTFGGCRKEL